MTARCLFIIWVQDNFKRANCLTNSYICNMLKSYKKVPHLSKRKYREIIRYFGEDINATTTSI